MKLHTSLWVTSIITLRFKLSMRFIEVRFEGVWSDSLEVYLIEVVEGDQKDASEDRARLTHNCIDGRDHYPATPSCSRRPHAASKPLATHPTPRGGGKPARCHVKLTYRVSDPLHRSGKMQKRESGAINDAS